MSLVTLLLLPAATLFSLAAFFSNPAADFRDPSTKPMDRSSQHQIRQTATDEESLGGKAENGGLSRASREEAAPLLS